jgi:SAM-dependent methyltransferase
MQLPFQNQAFGAVVCGFGLMYAPDWQAALIEARRVLVDGGVLLFSTWDRIEENPHIQASAGVLEAMFPGDPEMRYRRPYEMNDRDQLRRLLANARFGETTIETKRIPLEGADPRSIATGYVRGTPRSALIEQRGVSLDVVVEKITEALTRTGGDPYSGHAQAVIVQARAI